MSSRTYGELCLVSRSLDIVGERWTLLVIRELILGPKRFSELLQRLPAMGTNRLSSRLASLRAGGIVERTPLEAPGRGATYRLSPLGEGLRPVVFALARWGALLPIDGSAAGSRVRAELIALGLAAAAPPEAYAGLREAYEFRVDDEHFSISVDGSPGGRGITAQSGASAAPPTVTMTATVDEFLDVLSGHPAAATVTFAGDRDAQRRMLAFLVAAAAGVVPARSGGSAG